MASSGPCARTPASLRARLLAGLSLGVAVWLPACGSPPDLTGLVRSEAPVAELRLDLGALARMRPGPKRQLQQLGARDRARVRVDGLELPRPLELLVEADASGVAQVPGVRAGGVRVVSVGLLPASEDLATPPVQSTLVRLEAQASAPALAPLGPEWDLVGRAGALVLDFDRAEGTQVLGKVVPEELASAAAGIARLGGMASPSELSAEAFALKVRARGGRAPLVALDPSDRLPTGSVVLEPLGWPPGLWAWVRVGDPVSRPTFWNGEGPIHLDPVAAGEWPVELIPERPGLPPIATRISVAQGRLTRAGLGFGQAQAALDLPFPWGPGFFGLLGQGDAQRLVLGGGQVLGGEGGLELNPGLWRRDAAGAWEGLEAWPDPLRGAPCATGPQGQLVTLGGTQADGQFVAQAFQREAVASAAPRPLAELPLSLRRQDGLAAFLNGRYWVVGGTNQDGTAMAPMAFLDPGASQAQRAPLEMSTGRTLATGAVVGNRWIVVGGIRLASPSENEAGTQVPAQILGTTEAFEAKPVPRWVNLPPMPTPRAGAVAVAVQDALWVLGGADLFGRPLATVEVFKPSLGTWLTKPPLAVPRVRPAAAYLQGHIVVAGGAQGLSENAALLSSVELLTP